jgi:hypothetical protein
MMFERSVFRDVRIKKSTGFIVQLQVIQPAITHHFQLTWPSCVRQGLQKKLSRRQPVLNQCPQSRNKFQSIFSRLGLGFYRKSKLKGKKSTSVVSSLELAMLKTRPAHERP